VLLPIVRFSPSRVFPSFRRFRKVEARGRREIASLNARPEVSREARDFRGEASARNFDPPDPQVTHAPAHSRINSFGRY